VNLLSCGEGSNTILALGIPFQRAREFQPTTVAQEELAREMMIVERCIDRLVVVDCSLLHKIEQIQHVSAENNLAIINHFYLSNIVCSSEDGETM
jgi:hypothetical protein